MENQCEGRGMAWQVWYQDLFDRECPRQVQASGKGLVTGLVVLWGCFLRDSITPDGKKGFARFNLWLKTVGRSISIEGPWEGLVRLREWVVGGGRQPGADELLHRVAEVHANLAKAGKTSEAIARLAVEALGPEDFKRRLGGLEK